MAVLKSLMDKASVRLAVAFVGTYIVFAVGGWSRAVAAEKAGR